MRLPHAPLAALGLTGLLSATAFLPPQSAQAHLGGIALQQVEQRLDWARTQLVKGTADECVLVAGLATSARLFALQEELYLMGASCINEESGTPTKFANCLEELFDELALGLDEVEAQDLARLALCAKTGGGVYDPDLDEDDFLDEIDHKFLPLEPGSEWIYHQMSDEGLEVVTITVTGETKEIDGIEAIVVHDVVTLNGVLVEDTLDWFAQDEDGTVWYLGEIVQNFEDGELVDLDGSWKAGEEGALPGIQMLSVPRVGVTYRQELLLTEAEDAATVLSVNAKAQVPAGTFTGCVKTEDFTPLEPGHVEHKYYAPDVGLVLEVNVATGERLELMSYTGGRR
jgi:hypothetical protein